MDTYLGMFSRSPGFPDHRMGTRHPIQKWRRSLSRYCGCTPIREGSPGVPDGYLPLDSELEAVLTRVLRPVFPGARIIGWVPANRFRTGDGPYPSIVARYPSRKVLPDRIPE
jgi:hypothetical protein